MNNDINTNIYVNNNNNNNNGNSKSNNNGNRYGNNNANNITRIGIQNSLITAKKMLMQAFQITINNSNIKTFPYICLYEIMNVV